MASSIDDALARVKHDATALDPALIQDVCRELKYAWRDRALDPATTVALFVQQILHGNTPCSEVRHLVGKRFTPSAWCQARARLPLDVYRGVLRRTSDAALTCTTTRQDDHLWRGHRVFHADGTTFSMPDTPELQKAFGQRAGHKPGCGFPAAHLLVMFSAATGLLVDAVCSRSYTSDVSQASAMHAHLGAGDVLLGDDSYSGWSHVALLLQADGHGLFPVHHLQIVDFTPGRLHAAGGRQKERSGRPRTRWIASLGADDQLVEWFKPQQGPAWMTAEQYAALPASLTVREVRRTVTLADGRQITVTILTTLLDAARYPAEALVKLRMRRWDVETNLRHLKAAMGLEVLRCKTEAGVRKELAVFCIAYNLVRLVMLEAARRQAVAVERISFADALKWARHARPGDAMPPLIVNPSRPDRIEPRVVKRRRKRYYLMTRPRSVLRDELRKQRKKV
jgi:hypothetical protein